MPEPCSKTATLKSFQLVSSIASGSQSPDEVLLCSRVQQMRTVSLFSDMNAIVRMDRMGQYACSCWVHEECMEDIFLDNDGQE